MGLVPLGQCPMDDTCKLKRAWEDQPCRTLTSSSMFQDDGEMVFVVYFAVLLVALCYTVLEYECSLISENICK